MKREKGDDMKLTTCKVIALGFSGAYIVFVGFCMLTNQEILSEFVAIVSTVVGYYFGKSTALDMPKGGGLNE